MHVIAVRQKVYQSLARIRAVRAVYYMMLFYEIYVYTICPRV